MDESVPSELNTRALLSYCRGMIPLTPRLESWMPSLCQDTTLSTLVEEYSSPLNILNTEPFLRNITHLRDVAAMNRIDFDVYFARKANKCLAFVEAARSIGCGVDTASLEELQQVVESQVSTEKIVCTAAVKSEALLLLCIVSGSTIVIDNLDELMQTAILARELKQKAKIAIRLGGFKYAGEKLSTRFGFDVDELLPLLDDLQNNSYDCLKHLDLIGLHFHLDGYSRDQRITAIQACLPLIDALRARQFPIGFLDMGGGFPMSYLDSESEWDHFWHVHRQALLGESESLTYRNHGLGLTLVEGKLTGQPHCYPFFQTPVQENWFAEILKAECAGTTIAEGLRSRQIQLRCEPGRSILDGCGVTVARVEFRKQQTSGDWLIGVSMNRTQCRTSSDDFLVDPLLIPTRVSSPLPRTPKGISGYLVGAYCTESELLSLRKLQFPHGVALGDLILFPNTAGYFMHFLESRSHQFPLARNLIFDPGTDQYTRDAIDA